MLEEIKKEFIEKHRFLVKKTKGRFGTVHYQLGHIMGDYYNQNNQNKIFDSEEDALNSIWQFIEQKLTEAAKQAKIEENEYWEKKIFHPDSIMPGISIMDFAIRINELKETHN